MKTLVDTKAVNRSKYMFENEIEDHEKSKVPKKEITIQTRIKFEQKNPEELKYLSTSMNFVDKIQIAKKGSKLDISLSKPSNPIEF